MPIWLRLRNSPRVDLALATEDGFRLGRSGTRGKQLLAVLEFYSSHKLREDRDAMAAIETAATSLGQMLARSQERGRAEELYRQQQILLDSVADGICGVDGQGMVTFANPAAARLLGASPASLTGKSVHELDARQRAGEPALRG